MSPTAEFVTIVLLALAWAAGLVAAARSFADRGGAENDRGPREEPPETMPPESDRDLTALWGGAWLVLSVVVLFLFPVAAAAGTTPRGTFWAVLVLCGLPGVGAAYLWCRRFAKDAGGRPERNGPDR